MRQFIIVLVMGYFMPIFCTDYIYVKIGETHINEALGVLTDSKSLNWGEFNSGNNWFSYNWYLNVNSADIEILSEEQLKLNLNSATFYFDFNLAVLNPVAQNVNVTGSIICNYSVVGSLNDGYKVILHPESLDIEDWSPRTGVFGNLLNLVIPVGQDQVNLMLAEMPDIELNLGYSLLPTNYSYLFVGNPFFFTDLTGTEKYFVLRYEIKDEKIITVRNVMVPQSGEPTSDDYKIGEVAFYDYEIDDWGNWFYSPLQVKFPIMSDQMITTKETLYLHNAISHKLFNWDDISWNIYKHKNIIIEAPDTYDAKFYTAVNGTVSAVGDGIEALNLQTDHHGYPMITPYSEYFCIDPKYTKVTTPDIFETQNRKYVFLEWNDTESEDQYSRIRHFAPTGTPSYQAKYKGLHLSSEYYSLKNTNQRKVLQVLENCYLATYESMGKIWLEQSTDGVNWELVNGRKPISDENAKSPSFCLDEDYIQIIFQEAIENTVLNKTEIKIKIVEYSLASKLVTRDISLGNIPLDYATYDLQPTMAVIGNDCIAIWRVPVDVFPLDAGLYSAIGTRSYGMPFQWGNYYGPIENTGANSINASVVGKTSPNKYRAHLVWQEGDEEIMYQYLDMANPTAWHGYSEVSENIPSIRNTKPSMVVVGSDPEPRIVWVTERSIIQDDDKPGKVDAAATTKQMVLRGRIQKQDGTYGWNTQYFKFGSSVTDAFATHTFNDGNYVAGWSQSLQKKFITNSDWTIRDFGISGEGFNLSHAPLVADVTATAITQAAVPGTLHSLQTSSKIGQLINKKDEIITSTGREGIISKNESEIYFLVADIFTNGEQIEFVDVEENQIFENLDELANILKTKPFNVEDNSSVQLSLEYSAVDPAGLAEILEEEEYIKFYIEMRDVNTGEIVGVYDNVKFTNTNTESHKLVSYNLNMDGIGTRTVELALKIETNTDCKFSAAHVFAEEEVLAKRNFVEIEYTGDLTVKSFDMAQNYPNPFNPRTTIQYQLPESGMVQLVVYDLLGREVTKLVNEYQEKGRYNITFNGSSLSSGVYFYSISYSDKVITKKMMLLK